MHTRAMKHQAEALERLREREYFGLFMEQGTGKTWVLLADAERLYRAGKIEALLVVAPNGVHTNWVRREIPQHLAVEHTARAWKSGAGKKYARWMEEVFERRAGLRIFTMNIDALITKAGRAFATRFLAQYRSMLVVDESSRIKNPAAGRTKACMKLRHFAEYVRIATGTPVTNAPVDVFSQMELLHPGLLGTTNYHAFVAEYAELLQANHPMLQAMIRRNPRIGRAQIVARDAAGNPKWRNLDKLHRLLQPHTFRVRKEECLDLPPKIYQRHYFDLSCAQRRAYDLMKEECRMIVGEQVLPVQALSAAVKLQQITSGFLLHEGAPYYVSENNPRLKALLELIADLDGQFIVWARFREELRAIAERLATEQIAAVLYCGDVNTADREKAIDAFQGGKARGFIGQQQAAGLGLTLTAAETAIYYSNDFSLENRLQSEDRCHRKGTHHKVVYIDLVAENSIDEAITTALQRKGNMAAAIAGDFNQ